jgi:hypothetical protein
LRGLGWIALNGSEQAIWIDGLNILLRAMDQFDGYRTDEHGRAHVVMTFKRRKGL